MSASSYSKLIMHLCRQKRCWWRMLAMQCVGNNFEMMMTDLMHLKITNAMKKSPREGFCHQHLKCVTILKSPTSSYLSFYLSHLFIIVSNYLSRNKIRVQPNWFIIMIAKNPFLLHIVYHQISKFTKLWKNHAQTRPPRTKMAIRGCPIFLFSESYRTENGILGFWGISNNYANAITLQNHFSLALWGSSY